MSLFFFSNLYRSPQTQTQSNQSPLPRTKTKKPNMLLLRPLFKSPKTPWLLRLPRKKSRMELEFELTNNIIPEVKNWANKLLHTVPCLFFFACYARKKILPPTKCSHNYVRTCENFVSACENTFLTCENSCSHEAFSVSRYLVCVCV